MFRYMFIFTTMRQFVLRVLYTTLIIVFVLVCVLRPSPRYVCTLCITSVCTYRTFYTDLCFICMYILCHSCFIQSTVFALFRCQYYNVYGTRISCLCVTHLGVPIFLLYIHFLRYASLLFSSLLFFHQYIYFYFFTVILSLSQIMCFCMK